MEAKNILIWDVFKKLNKFFEKCQEIWFLRTSDKFYQETDGIARRPITVRHKKIAEKEVSTLTIRRVIRSLNLNARRPIRIPKLLPRHLQWTQENRNWVLTQGNFLSLDELRFNLQSDMLKVLKESRQTKMATFAGGIVSYNR